MEENTINHRENETDEKTDTPIHIEESILATQETNIVRKTDKPETISLKNVSKIYKMGGEKIHALNQVSLSFKQGQIYCLIGVSGSGKSTLLNVMAGLEKPSSGQIIFKGKHIEKMNEKQLALFRQEYIGFIFQQYNLLPTLTALENVTLPLIFRGVNRKKRSKVALNLLGAVGLKERKGHKPGELSGGQQQRVSIARAYVNKPSVVFADEPTGNLDEKTTLEMMKLIVDMAEENNQTLVVVTHNLELARYADTIIHMRDGSIEYIEENERSQISEKDIQLLYDKEKERRSVKDVQVKGTSESVV